MYCNTDKFTLEIGVRQSDTTFLKIIYIGIENCFLELQSKKKSERVWPIAEQQETTPRQYPRSSSKRKKETTILKIGHNMNTGKIKTIELNAHNRMCSQISKFHTRLRRKTDSYYDNTRTKLSYIFVVTIGLRVFQILNMFR